MTEEAFCCKCKERVWWTTSSPLSERIISVIKSTIYWAYNSEMRTSGILMWENTGAYEQGAGKWNVVCIKCLREWIFN